MTNQLTKILIKKSFGNGIFSLEYLRKTLQKKSASISPFFCSNSSAFARKSVKHESTRKLMIFYLPYTYQRSKVQCPNRRRQVFLHLLHANRRCSQSNVVLSEVYSIIEFLQRYFISTQKAVATPRCSSMERHHFTLWYEIHMCRGLALWHW